MSYDITVDDRAARQAFAQMPERAARGLRVGIEAGTALLVDGVQAAAPADTGLFGRSITSELRGSGIDLTGRVFSTDHPPKVAAIEHGRRPGKMPPVHLIQRWAARKGLGEEAGYVIARAIGRRGIKARHPFRTSVERRGRMAAAIVSRAVAAALRGSA